MTRFRTGLAVLGSLALLAACSGGSHAKADRVQSDAPSSTTIASPSTSAAIRAKKHATVPTKVATPTTVARTATRPTPTSPPATAGGGVIAAVAPGGAAPATLPPPTGGSTSGGGTQKPVKPFDPTQNIDLSGTPGVSPAQQAAAEALLRNTLRDLPRFASQSAAFAAGYRTIGDAGTGDEHWVNWAYANDSTILDSKHPESLVYSWRTGHPVLEAAMYMFPPGSRFTDIPAVYRNNLMQFHVHNDICFAPTSDPKQLVFAGLRNGQGSCPPGQTLAGNVPMIHAWIVKNPCGPFAALNGIGAGQVPDGETANCDTAHSDVL